MNRKRTVNTIFLLISLIFTACENNSTVHSIKVEDNAGQSSVQPTPTPVESDLNSPVIEVTPEVNNHAKADTYYVEALLAGYETMLIEAINENDFSRVEKYLLKDSELYQSQKKLVSDLYNRGIKEKLISYNVLEINSDNDEEYEVYVDEEISLKYPDSDKWVTKNYSWVYTASYDADNRLGLKEIKAWTK
jgi:uncharacterized membrane protein YvbJ